MMRHVVAALLAAAAVIPNVASAQDARDPQAQRQRPQASDEQRAARAERRAERQSAGGERQGGQPDRPQAAGRDRGGDGSRDARRDRGGDAQRQLPRPRDDSRADGGRGYRDRNGGGVADGRRDGGVADGRRDGGVADGRRDGDRAGLPASRDRNGDGRVDQRRDRDGANRGYVNRGYGQRWNGNSQRWSNNWRQDRRYDWNRYRAYNRGAFHLPRYYAPYGWNYGYRRFSIGFRLAAPLFGENYWIDDPYDYRLPPAYGPYRWVRYYGDAILVDVRSGYVVDVIHDIFW